jgi:Uma2 family endonuclease
MSAIPISETLMSPEEYLAFEEKAEERHEYLHGVVYAMAGSTREHDLICGDLFLALGNRLRGRRCTPFTANMKVRIRQAATGRFYYPDTMVVCGETQAGVYQTEPTAVFEVLSDSTERFDRTEKRDAYLSLPSLQVYVLIAQDKVSVEIWRRTGDGWQGEVLTEKTDTVDLSAIECSIPVAELYVRVGL